VIKSIVGLIWKPGHRGKGEMNKWKIPDWLEQEVKGRDRRCVYCGIEFGSSKDSKKSMATWEHIINDATIINRENIARCCFACNASKGTKKLSDWLKSDYCKKRGITKDTVAEVVKKALDVHPNRKDI
jgi:biotin synthase-like enzyme